MSTFDDSYFRTVELSDPELEVDGLRFVTVKSEAIGRRVDMCVYRPDNEEIYEDTPLGLLLHDAYGSHWSWAYQGAVHLTAAEMIEEEAICPMIIAMPSDGLWGDSTGYLKHSDADYEQWIVEEVPYAIREAIPEIDSGGPQFIAGMSMGGYGAMRIGAKYAEWFSGISTHSAITDLSQFPKFLEEPIPMFGDIDLNEASALHWLKANRDQLPPLRFDCGTEDPLLENNRFLHEQLKEAGIEHVYKEREGSHDWAYWQAAIRDTLLFFADIYDELGE